MLLFFLEAAETEDKLRRRHRGGTNSLLIQFGNSPVVKAHSVQKKLHTVFLSELLPVVFNDGRHVLDVTLSDRNGR